MAFGQQSGPPASHRQVKELLELLQNDGYTDFRDARGPMGFSQRQAGGKFTVDEAQAFIDQLQEAAYEAETGEAPPVSKPTVPSKYAQVRSAPPARKPAKKKPKKATKKTPVKIDPALEEFSSEQLAAELQRRGWIVAEP